MLERSGGVGVASEDDKAGGRGFGTLLGDEEALEAWRVLTGRRQQRTRARRVWRSRGVRGSWAVMGVHGRSTRDVG
jgi:hypothetical protein